MLAEAGLSLEYSENSLLDYSCNINNSINILIMKVKKLVIGSPFLLTIFIVLYVTYTFLEHFVLQNYRNVLIL